ncbi:MULTISPECIES: PrgI family protein [unclassified Ruminococcus]|uniref:PrgI family protein n=1 Tax=unclassified Ruminococcus TaxID=2608920 RepID=UPI00210E09BE|nr:MULTISPECIES: PrgI family protein [unclassified Ruminococcus]MCQ4021747.1 PrgI family protein [Ruminococcus sp. zg-924]MCQ4114191.1 PrgI family protein [Ruminococcus sp. zg-921]
MNNIHYVKIPQDIRAIKQKFMFGLTKRQLLCFGLGILLGFPVFFLLKFTIGDLAISIIGMGLVAMPFILCAFPYKGGTFDEYFKNMFHFLRSPKKRIYQSEDMFCAIERQIEYNRLYKLVDPENNRNLIDWLNIVKNNFANFRKKVKRNGNKK